MSHYTTWIAADYRTTKHTTENIYMFTCSKSWQNNVVTDVDSGQYEGITLPKNPQLLSTSKTEMQ